MTFKFLGALTACALLMGAGCSYPKNEAAKVTQPVSSEWLRNTSTPTVSFIDADVFAIPELMAPAAQPLSEEAVFTCKKYRAGIVNHHALASDLLAAFFRTLERCRSEIKTIIILSPDHFGQASAAVTTHRLPYRVSGSEILVDGQAVERLNSSIASHREDAAPFVREHGIGALVPFLDAELKIVPVIIRSQIDDTSRTEIAVWLRNELKNPTTFVAVSSDMSHYLAAEVAWAKQAETDQALSVSDIDFFASAKDAHTDNGESIAVVLQALGKTKWTLLRESISSDYAGSPGFTTTYAIGFWD